MKHTLVSALLAVAGFGLLAAPVRAEAKAYTTYEDAARQIHQHTLDRLGKEGVDSDKLIAKAQDEVDAVLNKAYLAILGQLRRRDPELAALFQADQQAWLQFVDVFLVRRATGFGQFDKPLFGSDSAYARLTLWVQRVAYFQTFATRLGLGGMD